MEPITFINECPALFLTFIAISRHEPGAYALDLVGSRLASAEHRGLGRFHRNHFKLGIQRLEVLLKRNRHLSPEFQLEHNNFTVPERIP